MASIVFLAWLSHGKIRNSVLFENMKTTNKIFVNALKYCERNENVIRNNILSESLSSKNMFCFWKEIKSRTVTSQKMSGVVDGRDTDTDIANVFYEKFSSISGKGVSSPNSLRPINNHRTFSNLSKQVNKKSCFHCPKLQKQFN